MTNLCHSILAIVQDGSVAPCSRVYKSYLLGHLQSSKLEDIWQNPRSQSFRRIMLSSSRPYVCQFCNDQDQAQIPAYRDQENARLKADVSNRQAIQQEFMSTLQPPKSIEVRFSNICNLRCRTCNEEYSSSWFKEAADLNPRLSNLKIDKAFQDAAAFNHFKDVTLKNIESIQFLGGEPLIHEEFYQTLEQLILLKKTDVQIHITTNLTHLHYKDYSFLKIIQNFSNVHLALSLDGIEERSEYIRKGSNWESVKKNFRSLQLFGNVQLSIYPAISVFNCFHLPDAIDDWIQHKFLLPGQRLAFNVVLNPSHYSPYIFNNDERLRLKEKYRLFIESKKDSYHPTLLRDVENYLQSILMIIDNKIDLQSRAQFQRITRILDQKRNENFLATFPELKTLLDT